MLASRVLAVPACSFRLASSTLIYLLYITYYSGGSSDTPASPEQWVARASLVSRGWPPDSLGCTLQQGRRWQQHQLPLGTERRRLEPVEIDAGARELAPLIALVSVDGVERGGQSPFHQPTNPATVKLKSC